MLCYVMLCYVMLCYVMLCYVMLCYVTRWSYLLCVHSKSLSLLFFNAQYHKTDFEFSTFSYIVCVFV